MPIDTCAKRLEQRTSHSRKVGPTPIPCAPCDHHYLCSWILMPFVFSSVSSLYIYILWEKFTYPFNPFELTPHLYLTQVITWYIWPGLLLQSFNLKKKNPSLTASIKRNEKKRVKKKYYCFGALQPILFFLFLFSFFFLWYGIEVNLTLKIGASTLDIACEGYVLFLRPF
jgi:hypothetical protein